MSTADELFATPLQFLKGVGPRRAADFAHAGLTTVEELLYRFPLRYEDRSQLRAVASLKPGESVSVDRLAGSPGHAADVQTLGAAWPVIPNLQAVD